MSIITNLPASMIAEHVNWHSKPGNPMAGGRAINPWPPSALGSGGRPAAGSGEEFLVWHKGFLERFHQWVGTLPNNQRPAAADIAPWMVIPSGLKMGMVGWDQNHAADEVQLGNMSNFNSLDELGRFLEWGLHGWLHVASASMWGESVLTSLEAPRSAYFWQLHGLIDSWRQAWVDAQQVVQPNLEVDRIKEMIELKKWMDLLGHLDEPHSCIPRPQPDPSPVAAEPGDLRLVRALRELDLSSLRRRTRSVPRLDDR